jgi:PBP1b-binding outer membrane lipoprotein LpoB
MKTITKTLAALSLAAFGLAGCADSNENVMARDATGKVTQGVNPPGLDKTSAGANKAQPGAMSGEKAKAKYAGETGQGGTK